MAHVPTARAAPPTAHTRLLPPCLDPTPSPPLPRPCPVAQVLCTGFVPVDSAELVGEYYGESEAKLRKIFADARGAARRTAAGAAGVGSSACGVVLFFDEVDALCAKREQAGGVPHCAPGPMLGRVGRWSARPNRCELEHAACAHICAGEMERRLVTTFLCEMDEFLPGDKVVTD